MKKTVLTVLVMLLPMLLLPESDEVRDGIDALLETIDLSEWDEWFRKNGGENAILPSDLLRQLTEMQMPANETGPDALLSYLKPSIKPAAAKVALLMGLAVLGAALQGISDGSAAGETAQTAFRICASAAVLILVISEVRTAIGMISTAERTAELLLPVITGFLAFCGLENTALLLPASFTLLSDAVLGAAETVVVPLAVIGGVLIILDTNGKGWLAPVGKLLQRTAKRILLTGCSFYLVVTAVRSFAAGNADGLLLKTTKFAAGSVPSIGSLLSESVDTAFRCLRFVRQALGLTGCAILLAVALKPVLSVLLTRSCFVAASLLSEPLSGKPYAGLLRGMGDTLQILLLSELAATAMSILMIAPVFVAGGTP